jgi:hypothetical protein
MFDIEFGKNIFSWKVFQLNALWAIISSHFHRISILFSHVNVHQKARSSTFVTESGIIKAHVTVHILENAPAPM